MFQKFIYQHLQKNNSPVADPAAEALVQAVAKKITNPEQSEREKWFTAVLNDKRFRMSKTSKPLSITDLKFILRIQV